MEPPESARLPQPQVSAEPRFVRWVSFQNCWPRSRHLPKSIKFPTACMAPTSISIFPMINSSSSHYLRWHKGILPWLCCLPGLDVQEVKPEPLCKSFQPWPWHPTKSSWHPTVALAMDTPAQLYTPFNKFQRQPWSCCLWCGVQTHIVKNHLNFLWEG